MIEYLLKRKVLKIYDELRLLLRVESGINQPGELKVLRACQHRDGASTTGCLRCARGLAIYTQIKAMTWPATNDIWKRSQRSKNQRRVTTIGSN